MRPKSMYNVTVCKTHLYRAREHVDIPLFENEKVLRTGYWFLRIERENEIYCVLPTSTESPEDPSTFITALDVINEDVTFKYENVYNVCVKYVDTEIFKTAKLYTKNAKSHAKENVTLKLVVQIVNEWKADFLSYGSTMKQLTNEISKMDKYIHLEKISKFPMIDIFDGLSMVLCYGKMGEKMLNLMQKRYEDLEINTRRTIELEFLGASIQTFQDYDIMTNTCNKSNYIVSYTQGDIVIIENNVPTHFVNIVNNISKKLVGKCVNALGVQSIIQSFNALPYLKMKEMMRKPFNSLLDNFSKHSILPPTNDSSLFNFRMIYQRRYDYLEKLCSTWHRDEILLLNNEAHVNVVILTRIYECIYEDDVESKRDIEMKIIKEEKRAVRELAYSENSWSLNYIIQMYENLYGE